MDNGAYLVRPDMYVPALILGAAAGVIAIVAGAMIIRAARRPGWKLPVRIPLALMACCLIVVGAVASYLVDIGLDNVRFFVP
ncbi:MAG TPA: hypothetical protein VNE62_02960 [Actinomycetota bacterium]|nr:hypothetical protein [Actinomycetota bacterium]